MQEQALLDHLKRLERGGHDDLAVQLHLSRLTILKRLPDCRTLARTMMSRAATARDTSLFDLSNGDLVLIYDRRDAEGIEADLMRLRLACREDPFFAGGSEADRAFCSYFDLGDGYDALAGRITGQLAKHKEGAKAGKGGHDNGPALSLADLAAVEKAIAQADLSVMTSRQAICQLDEDGRPRCLFQELYISLATLRDTLLPGHDVYSDPWLLQHLTTQMDQRILAWLAKNDDSTLRHSFSININVASVLTPRFMALDEELDQQRRNTIFVELQMLDIFADFGRYLFVRDFLLDRGYRICLDGITELSLPHIDRRQLGAELVKLRWSKTLRNQVEKHHHKNLRKAIDQIDPKRLILTHCKNDEAIELGHQLGIQLYQGPFLDHLLQEGITRNEAAERLGAALMRHRRHLAQAQAAVSS